MSQNSCAITSPKEVLETVINDNDFSLQQGGIGAMVENFLNAYFIAHEGLMPSNGLYDLVMQEVERPLLRTTLKLVNGNQKKAAIILGINRNTLRKKLTDLQIDIDNL
jgi:two-component system nitrogen regulation response regulator GlnG